ncbi:MAG: TetR/AcrR family transcriptional regulator [Nocardioidaceae bacterium]|nr:TetR/AcrR family transcriptional regulator [Nocardioidaceae bacterium]
MARPKTYDDRLRRTLIDTAAELIAAQGAEALALRPLAERCGTSTNAIYTLFGSKAGLVMAVITEAAASFTEAQRGVAATDDPLADLIGLGRAYRGWARSQPALYAVMFGDRVPLPEAASKAEVDSMEPLLTTVSRAMAAGLLRPGDPMVAATSIWAGIHGWVSLEIAGRLSLGDAADDHVEEHLAAIATYWLAAPGGPCGDVTPG